MPVTAETMRPVTGPSGDNPITDKQIHELRLQVARAMDSALQRSRIPQAQAIGAEKLTSWEDLHAVFRSCEAALGRVRNSRRVKGYKAAAREQCAAAWNARHPATVLASRRDA